MPNKSRQMKLDNLLRMTWHHRVDMYELGVIR
jgi:hypothetical protein